MGVKFFLKLGDLNKIIKSHLTEKKLIEENRVK
jgi:hypothetical protein